MYIFYSLNMRTTLIPLLLLALLPAGCSGDRDFNSLPKTGFITSYQPSDKKRMSFDSYWDISDNKDWNERVDGVHGKSQEIYIMPVTTKYLDNYPADKEKAEDVEEIRAYFDRALKTKLSALDKKDNSFHLVGKPTPNSYRIEIALLSITPTNVPKNSMGAVASALVPGSGTILSATSPKGSIAMGAKFYAPNGKLVGEVADFERDQSSLVSMVLIDFKDFQYYAHHKRHIDIWCDQFCEIFTTRHEHKIKRPWFTLNPF